MEYMKQNLRRIDAITTKEHLQEFLVDFHNAVNVRKGKPVFTYKQAEDKYRLAKTSSVIQYFFQIYGEKSNGNLKMFTNGFQKQILLSEFSAWIVNNYSSFYQYGMEWIIKIYIDIFDLNSFVFISNSGSGRIGSGRIGSD